MKNSRYCAVSASATAVVVVASRRATLGTPLVPVLRISSSDLLERTAEKKVGARLLEETDRQERDRHEIRRRRDLPWIDVRFLAETAIEAVALVVVREQTRDESNGRFSPVGIRQA